MPKRVPTLTAAELLDKEGMYKVVRAGEEYRFLAQTHFGPRHKDMVGETERCTAAGTIFIQNKTWYLEDPYSSSLRIGFINQRDIIDLQSLLAQVGFTEKDKP